MNTARYRLGGLGIQTAALGFAGLSGPTGTVFSAVTEEWNGTSWTTQGSLATAAQQIRGTGTVSAGLAFGGSSAPGASLSSTSEYTGAYTTLNYKTLTTS